MTPPSYRPIAAVFSATIAWHDGDAAAHAVGRNEVCMSLSLADVTVATFEPCRGDTFRLIAQPAAGEPMPALRLHEVRDLGAGQRTGGAFVLTFVGPAGPHLPQAIHPLTNDRLGTLEIFLVPIGPIEDGNGYEAVFN